MRPFDFTSAASVDKALATQGRFLAGGTTLLDLMKLEVETPAVIVDVTRLPLTKVSERAGSLWIGSMVTNSDLAHNELVKKRVPVLSQALLSGASPQLRNLATTGGNLLQRTRCSYFRDTAWACNKRVPGSGCSALAGVSRSHALLGVSDHCLATSPSDMNVALAALGARLHLQTKTAKRMIAISDFYRKPEATPQIETVLQPGELITEIEIPLQPWFKQSRYLKIRDRASYAFALSSAAVALDLSGTTIRQARVALGGIATVPWRSAEAERILTGQKRSSELYIRAADAALAGAKTTKHNAFKLKLAKQTLIRALEEFT